MDDMKKPDLASGCSGARADDGVMGGSEAVCSNSDTSENFATTTEKTSSEAIGDRAGLAGEDDALGLTIALGHDGLECLRTLVVELLGPGQHNEVIGGR